MNKKHILYITLTISVIGLISLFSPLTTKVEALECGILPQSLCDSATDGGTGDVRSSAVWQLLRLAISILSAGVAIAAVGGIVYGAILYTTAGGNQEQVKKARTLLTNVVIGIVVFAAMFALIQWLIPGGVF